MNGFFGRILVIDLDACSAQDEQVPEEVYRDHLGGKGLATWLLLRDNPAGVDPFSPENRLIFAVGPLTDLKVHGSARFGVFTKSPLTGYYCESYSGGTVADHLSRTGYDAVVLKGAAAEPTWLEVSDRGVRFHSAAGLWGAEAYAAEAELRHRAGKSAGVVVIGPAGERRVRFATINNNRWRCAGRSGAGAVLGAKKVKGLVFHGGRRRRPAAPELLECHFRELAERGRTDPGAARYRRYGTPMMVKVTNEAAAFPARYWELSRRDDWERISAETLLAECRVQARACPRCFMACGKLSEVKNGRYKGLRIEGPEYETIYAFGGLCLIPTLPEIMYLNDLCDRLGLDTITTGNLIAFTMHAAEKGRIAERIAYGDTEKAAELIRQIAAGAGTGGVLAEGIVAAAKAWGMEDAAVHVKGLELAGYDPRKLKGMGLAYAVSDRGACHLRSTFYKPELSGMIAPESIAGKAELFLDFEDRATLFDTMILCRFFRDLLQWEELKLLVYAATGMESDQRGLKKIAARVTDLTRLFNLREGLAAEEDNLPPALFAERLKSGDPRITREELARLVQEYYRLRGWDEKGVPRNEGK